MSAEHRSALVQICTTWQYRLLQLAFDLLALVTAWYGTVELRLLLNPFMVLKFSVEDAWRVAPPPGGILLLWIAVIPWLGASRRRRAPDSREASVGSNLLRTAEASLVSGALLIVAAFFERRMGVG